MKKALLLSMILLLCLCGCDKKSLNYIIKNKPSILGTVTEISENSFTMEIIEMEGYTKDSLIVIPKEAENKDSYTDYQVGDQLYVYFDGNVMETYPLQISKVYAICYQQNK